MRDNFSDPVKRALANRVAGKCSNPDCGAVTVGPQGDPAKFTNIGVAAHITAAAPGGPRYDATLSLEERYSPENGIWLCQNCAKLVDNDPARFSVATLKKWKSLAELWTQSILGKPELGANQASTAPETELLVAAADAGEILLIPLEAPDQLGYRWVRVGQENFADDDDPAFAATYRDALDALVSQGLVRHESRCRYYLSAKGFKVARQLKEAISANSHQGP